MNSTQVANLSEASIERLQNCVQSILSLTRQNLVHVRNTKEADEIYDIFLSMIQSSVLTEKKTFSNIWREREAKGESKMEEKQRGLHQRIHFEQMLQVPQEKKDEFTLKVINGLQLLIDPNNFVKDRDTDYIIGIFDERTQRVESLNEIGIEICGSLGYIVDPKTPNSTVSLRSNRNPRVISDCICPICKEPCSGTPYPLPCFHSYCFSCIETWGTYSKTCPTCRTPFS